MKKVLVTALVFLASCVSQATKQAVVDREQDIVTLQAEKTTIEAELVQAQKDGRDTTALKERLSAIVGKLSEAQTQLDLAKERVLRERAGSGAGIGATLIGILSPLAAFIGIPALSGILSEIGAGLTAFKEKMAK